MEASKRRKLIIAGSAITLIAVAGIIYKIIMPSAAQEKVLDILHLGNKVSVKGDTQSIKSGELMKKYYDMYGYQELWTGTQQEGIHYRSMLVQMLNYADSLGLDTKDYHLDFVTSYDSMSHGPNFDFTQYKTESEMIFTDAALSFLYNVAYGKEINLAYNGIKPNIDSARIARMFSELLVHGNWRLTLDSIEPNISQYRLLKDKLNYMKAFVRDFPEMDSLAADNSDGGNVVAALKLRFYGFITDSLAADSNGNVSIKNSVKDFQRMMSYDTTGKLDDKTLKALNAPMLPRMMQIKESLNYWRWTGRVKEEEFILVNIPAARLQVVNDDSAKDLTMRVIVGKTITQTPSFTAYISKVIAYPYWTVPISIATKEMLPKIRKSLDYLEDNNLQVLDSKGEELDPSTIKWKKYSEKYFPFTIRQGTGCDNSLGVLKFDLNSPFSIYLHDTNHRELFAKKDRFMSHGCIRVEKPMELAHYILDDGLDSATMVKLNQCLRDQKPQDFFLKKRFPVLILYMPADIDANGNLKFYNDIYDLEDGEIKKAA